MGGDEVQIYMSPGRARECIDPIVQSASKALSVLAPQSSHATGHASGDAVDAKEQSPILSLQQKLQAARLPLAICCGAVAALAPILGALCISLAMNNEGDWKLRQQDMSESSFSGPSSVGASPSSLIAIEAFRQDLALHEASQRSSESTMHGRVQLLEEGVNKVSDIVPQESIFVAVSTLSLASLGVDWAARTSGASIDHANTSPALGLDVSGSISRAIAAVMPRYKSHVGMVSHAPEVALAVDAAPPSRCFAFHGNGTLAVQLSRAMAPTHAVVERLVSSWAQEPLTAPKHVEVMARLEGAALYVESLGTFEYLLDGPQAQVFSLQGPSRPVRALMFRFGANWGADHTSICRVRIFASDDRRDNFHLPGRREK